jgi:hypothetical protein
MVVGVARVLPRPTSELLFDIAEEDGGTACSARNGTDGEWASGRVAKTS